MCVWLCTWDSEGSVLQRITVGHHILGGGFVCVRVRVCACVCFLVAPSTQVTDKSSRTGNVRCVRVSP